MTEAEWLTTRYPQYMLKAYPAPWDERKACLAGCAILRRAPQLLNHPQTRHYLEVVERVVEGRSAQEEFEQVWKEVYYAAQQCHSSDEPAFERYSLLRGFTDCPSCDSLIDLVKEITHRVSRSPGERITSTAYRKAQSREEDAQCAILRDIFGNPFRPVTLDPSWLTSTVVLLAQGIYEERAFDRMPILADALQDAGCDNDDVLYHCRGFDQCLRCGGTGRSVYDWGYAPPPMETCPECTGTGWSAMKTPHVRGCWVVDLLLGKS